MVILSFGRFCLAKYINATGDKEILNIKVPFTTLKTAEKINEATIYQHVVRQVETIQAKLHQRHTFPVTEVAIGMIPFNLPTAI